MTGICFVLNEYQDNNSCLKLADAILIITMIFFYLFEYLFHRTSDPYLRLL